MADILLLEPNRILARNYVATLKEAGHTVRHCPKGQTAIELADKQTPDLVIVELQLAAHNGLEFLYEFRSYMEWQTIPVIVLSIVPHNVVNNSTAVVLLNISRYLYKPSTTLKKLVDAVEETIHKVPA